MDNKQFQELSEKHSEIIEYMKEHDNIVYWYDANRTKNIGDLIFAAIPDVIQSYYETGTYMLNSEFINEL